MEAEATEENIWMTAPEFSRKFDVNIWTVYSRMKAKKFKKYIREVEGKLYLHSVAFTELVSHKMKRNVQPYRGGNQHTMTQNSNRISHPYRTTSARPDAVASGVRKDSQVTDYLDEKRKWSARFEELRYKKTLREAVSARSVASEAATIARLARDQLLQIPDRISGDLINISSYDTVFSILNGEINRVLKEMTAAIEKIDVADGVILESDPDSKKVRPVVSETALLDDETDSADDELGALEPTEEEEEYDEDELEDDGAPFEDLDADMDDEVEYF